ncbi:MAG: hypothetical protein O2999_14270 [Nitrospirae bacterium]|nr:hypothetical protein [Nitrospirota bacterium]MDA1305427.1 hypothetical protein [Nitrospirota bacterium]
MNGACKAYHEICKEYENVCKAGYKEACKNVLRPYAKIKDELYWLLYQEYMKSIGASYEGAIYESIRKDLQPFYTVSLDTVRVSLGSASDGAGITDCTHIHFPDEELVHTLQSGEAIANSSKLHCVLHELKHVQQCQDIGSRKKYGVMWFSQFEITLKVRIDETIRDALSLLSGKGAKYVHDAMPMEKDAEDYANSILDKVRSDTRHGHL